MITNARVVIENNQIVITKGKVRVRIAPTINGLVISGTTNTVPNGVRLWDRTFRDEETEQYMEKYPEKHLYPGWDWHG